MSKFENAAGGDAAPQLTRPSSACAPLLAAVTAVRKAGVHAAPVAPVSLVRETQKNRDTKKEKHHHRWMGRPRKRT